MDGVALSGRRRRDPQRLPRTVPSGWVGVVVGLVVLAAGWSAIQDHRSRQALARRAQDQKAVASAAHAIEAQLQRALETVRTVATQAQGAGSRAALERLAADLLVRQPLVAVVAIASGGAAQPVYSGEGPDAAAGRRLLADPAPALIEATDQALQRGPVLVGWDQPMPRGDVGIVAMQAFRSADAGEAAAAGPLAYAGIVMRMPTVASMLADAGLPVAVTGFSLVLPGAESAAAAASPAPLALAAPVHAVVRLPQGPLILSAATGVAAPSRWLEAAAALLALLLGLAATLAIRRHRGPALVRRLPFQPGTLSGEGVLGLDDVQRQVDQLGQQPGWTVMMAVGLPVRPGGPAFRHPLTAAAAAVWRPTLRALMREPDLVMPMRAQEYLLVLHGIFNRADAAQVRRRMERQLLAAYQRETGDATAVPFIATQIAEGGQGGLDKALTDLLVQLHDAVPARTLSGDALRQPLGEDLAGPAEQPLGMTTVNGSTQPQAASTPAFTAR